MVEGKMKKSFVFMAVLFLAVFLISCGDEKEVNDETKKDDASETKDDESSTDKDDTKDESGQPDESETTEEVEIPDIDTAITEDDLIPDDEESVYEGDGLCAVNIEREGISTDMTAHLKGIWVQELSLVADAKVPVVNDIVTTTKKYVRVEIIEENGFLVLKEMMPCDMNTYVTEGNAIAKTIKTTFPRKFKEHFTYFGPHHLKTPLKCFTVSGTPDNFNLKFNKWYEMRGAYFQGENGTDPFDLETDMITSSDDPRIFDHDEDTRPGHTFEIQSTIANGLIWGVIKNSMELAVMNASGTKLFGPANWGEVNHIIDVSNSLFAGERIINARPDKSYFKMVKLEKELTCDEIVPKLKELFQ